MEATEERTVNPDKITICVFFREADIATGEIHTKIAGEVANIRGIQGQFNAAATELGLQPPEIFVSVLVVPDWDAGSSYAPEKTGYQTNGAMVLGRIRDDFTETGIVVNDFYADLIPEEREYLNGLNEGSNCLDMMKIKSIISNADCRHLQLDSNTIITDYRGLYGATFDDNMQCDALNASFYGDHHVTPHSKIVYTHSTGVINPELQELYDKYLKNPGEKNQPEQFYKKVFSKGMKNAKLSIQNTGGGGTFLYADLSKPEYRITRDMVTSVNKSHRGVQRQNHSERILSQIVPWPLRVESRNLIINCTSSLIKSLIRKYTSEKYPDTCHQQLVALSDEGLEHHILRSYLMYAPMSLEQKQAVIKLIPNNPYGNQLVTNLFEGEYTVSRLYEENGISDSSKPNIILPRVSNPTGTLDVTSDSKSGDVVVPSSTISSEQLAKNAQIKEAIVAGRHALSVNPDAKAESKDRESSFGPSMTPGGGGDEK